MRPKPSTVPAFCSYVKHIECCERVHGMQIIVVWRVKNIADCIFWQKPERNRVCISEGRDDRGMMSFTR